MDLPIDASTEARLPRTVAQQLSELPEDLQSLIEEAMTRITRTIDPEGTYQIKVTLNGSGTLESVVLLLRTARARNETRTALNKLVRNWWSEHDVAARYPGSTIGIKFIPSSGVL